MNQKIKRQLKGMYKVLKSLDFLKENGILNLKGLIGCEIVSGMEIVKVELLFHGMFRNLDSKQISSLLSCFIFNEPTSSPIYLKKPLDVAFKILKEVVKKITKIQKETGLELDSEIFNEKFKPNIMHVIYNWCNGYSFKDVCESTNIMEGSIIRTMRRLEEMLGELEKACFIIGDQMLLLKFKEARKLMKRDIVFTSSLYL